MAESELRAKIERDHKFSNFFFWMSTPGLISTIYSLSNEIISGRFTNLVNSIVNDGKTDSNEHSIMVRYALPVVIFLVPFESSELLMERMKKSLRIYLQVPDRINPIKYNFADYAVNKIMKIAHDRSPLP